MPEDTLAPPAGPGQPLRGVVQVHTGIILGVPQQTLSRRWDFEVPPDPAVLRDPFADRLTEAYEHVRRLPFPEVLSWMAVYAHWL
jgi:hypothetical protein